MTLKLFTKRRKISSRNKIINIVAVQSTVFREMFCAAFTQNPEHCSTKLHVFVICVHRVVVTVKD